MKKKAIRIAALAMALSAIMLAGVMASVFFYDR